MCFNATLDPWEQIPRPITPPSLTGKVLFIHAVAGRLHGHLQHPDAAVVGRQHDLVWSAPVDVEDAVVDVAADAHAADHLDLREKFRGEKQVAALKTVNLSQGKFR